MDKVMNIFIDWKDDFKEVRQDVRKLRTQFSAQFNQSEDDPFNRCSDSEIKERDEVIGS